MLNTPENLPPLLKRIKAHVEHGISLSVEDRIAAFQPGCLVYAATTLGGLMPYSNERVGNAYGPPTERARAYDRAQQLVLLICHALEVKLAQAQSDE